MSDTLGPYLLEDAAAKSLCKDLATMDERVITLRATGVLSETTLQQYYGRTRFEQIAESNALEGSTLDVGETELAILKGVTLTGHDPQYVRDAKQLDLALKRLTELARSQQPTSILHVKEIHELILGDRPSAGHFRATPVQLRGQRHKPPATWSEVMRGIEQWETWSQHYAGTA